jgi:hypothetical protein
MSVTQKRWTGVRPVLVLLLAAVAVGWAGGLLAVTRTWTGATSTDWNTATNWNPAGVPAAADDVQINSATNQPILPANPQAVCLNLTIFPTGVLHGGSGVIDLRGNWTNASNNGTGWDAQTATILINGTVAQTISNSSFAVNIGNVTMANTSAAGANFPSPWPLANTGTLTVNAACTLTMKSNCDFTNSNVVNNGKLVFGNATQTITGKAGLNLGNCDFKYNTTAGAMTVTGPCGFKDLTMTANGQVTFTGAITLTGNFAESLTGNITMTGTGSALIFAGTTAQTFLLNTTASPPRLSVGQIVVNNDADVKFGGTFAIRSKGSLNPAFEVKGPTVTPGSKAGKVTLGGVFPPAATFTACSFNVNGTGGESLIKIGGTLASTAGTGANRPKFLGGVAPADHARMLLSSTGVFDVDGLVLDHFGNNAAAYALNIGAGSIVTKLDNLSILQSSAVTALIDLNTGNLPSKEKIEFLEVEAAPGGPPKNIDANSVTGFVLHITSGPNSGNNRYGIPFEEDSNNVLSWDSAAALSVATTSPLNPEATEGVFYQFTMQATGGNAPYTWSFGAVTPAAPWLIFDAAGNISGTPPTGSTGAYTFTVTVTDSTLPIKTANANMQLNVKVVPPPSPTIITYALPDATEGIVYPAGIVISAISGTPPYAFSVDVASPDQLPAGLTLDGVTGAITGTPQFVLPTSVTSQNYTVNFVVTDSLLQVATQVITMRLYKGVPPLFITTSFMSNAEIGKPYTFTLGAVGGVQPYTWDLAPGSANLPLGITLAGSGLFFGTAHVDTEGTYTITVRVNDAQGNSITRVLLFGVDLTVIGPVALDGGGGSKPSCTIGSDNGVPVWLLLVPLAAGVMLLRRRKLARQRV